MQLHQPSKIQKLILVDSLRSNSWISIKKCLVLENIHTPTKEGIGNSEGVVGGGGGFRGPGNSRGEAVCIMQDSF